MNKELALVVYSNSEYYDVLNVFDKCYLHYANLQLEKYLFSDTFNVNFKTIKYDNSFLYTERLLNCLQQIDYDNILFLHEDMILYDYVKKEEFDKIYQIYKNNNFDYIKLIKTGVHSGTEIFSNIYNFDKSSDTAFAVQPTIWKTNSLINFLKINNNKNIWQLERDSQEVAKKLNGFYYHNKNSKKRGQAHWDSFVFPYIATAIVKGRWNFMEYKDELLNIDITHMKINFLQRGLFV